MPLSVGDALRDGFGRTLERNGLVLVAAFVAVRLASAVANNTLNLAAYRLAVELGTLPTGPVGALLPDLTETPLPLALDVGVMAAIGLVIAVAVAAEAARIVAVRTFVSDQVDTVPLASARRRIVVATLNGVVGGLVVGTLTTFGLALLVLPGIFVAVSFFFVRQEIAVRDVTFVDAMAGSWALTDGHRFGVFALALVLGLVNLAAGGPVLAVSGVSPLAGVLVGSVVQGVAVVFGIASVSRAYVQLREAPDEPEPDPYAGALTAEDLPPPESHDRQ